MLSDLSLLIFADRIIVHEVTDVEGLFFDMFCACPFFVRRVAGIPFQAHQLLCADGECCSHSDAGPWCPASADPTWTSHTGRTISQRGTQYSFGLLKIIMPVTRTFSNCSNEKKNNLSASSCFEPSLRIVSIDGGWKSLNVHDPAPAGSCFFPERIRAKLSCALLPGSLALLLLSPPRSLSLCCPALLEAEAATV